MGDVTAVECVAEKGGVSESMDVDARNPHVSSKKFGGTEEVVEAHS